MAYIPLQKTIRPTKLQPQLFSVVKQLSHSNDYRVVVDKDNKPLCVMVSYSLIKDINLEESIASKYKNLEEEMNLYYSSMPQEEIELINKGIDYEEL